MLAYSLSLVLAVTLRDGQYAMMSIRWLITVPYDCPKCDQILSIYLRLFAW
jgi:hypothetical protein